MISLTDQIIETEVEAYVVPGMSVPILLGEDNHLNYELTVQRNLGEGTTISYLSNDSYVVPSIHVDKSNKFQQLRSSEVFTNREMRERQRGLLCSGGGVQDNQV